MISASERNMAFGFVCLDVCDLHPEVGKTSRSFRSIHRASSDGDINIGVIAGHGRDVAEYIRRGSRPIEDKTGNRTALEDQRCQKQ